jgi:hypothetical protein
VQLASLFGTKIPIEDVSIVISNKTTHMNLNKIGKVVQLATSTIIEIPSKYA